LKDPKLQDVFGADLPALKGKNVKGIFKSKPAKSSPVTPYDAIINGELNKVATKVAKGQTDINSALREAEENANKLIQETK
jgi:multiple sugar transport system substrate-binding protein